MTAPKAESLHDSKTNLLEARQAVIQDQEEKLDAERIARMSATGRRRRIGMLGTLGIAGLILLILQPTWLAGPKVVSAEPPSIAAASMRLTLLRERDRVRAYLEQHGRLPASIAEAGGAVTGISLRALPEGGFTLVGETTDSIITLHSSDSV
jgi:hypothetical protein